jgi:hypothetical protein
MTKAPSASPLRVAVAAIIVVFVAASSGAEAMIESTCRAATEPWTSRSAWRGSRRTTRQWRWTRGGWPRQRRSSASASATTPGSTSVAAMSAPPAPSGARGKAAVEACSKAYDVVAGMAFAEAADWLGARRRRRRWQAWRCDGGFVAVGTRKPPALARYGVDCQMMAVIIDIAITNLNKGPEHSVKHTLRDLVL